MVVKAIINKIFKQCTLPVLLLLLVVFFSMFSPKFFTLFNLRNILIQNVHVAIVTMAVAIIMISGGVDLSLGYQVSIVSVIVSMCIAVYHVPFVLAVIFGILVCVILSSFNGFLMFTLKSHSMIITLGTMAIYQGISYTISNAKSFFGLPPIFLFLGQGSFSGIPVNIIILLVIFVVVTMIMSKTFIGKFVYAVGDNPETAWLSGIRVSKVKQLSFTFSGLLTGIAAVLLVSRTGSGDSAMGLGLEFTGITACVLGGVSLKGGEGQIWKTIVAVYILGVLSNGMQMIGLGAYPQYIAKGAVMLLSIAISNNIFRFGGRRRATLQW
jgi:ribose/xylose/arabinose/galactoside ABC-type transport system permease subunit